MNPPALLFYRFLISCALGVGLGILYDLTSSLPRLLRHLGDFLFVLVLFIVGIYLGFGVCRGDLRPVYSAGLFLGLLAWHYTVGKLFRQFFTWVFRTIRKPFSIFWSKLKKTAKFIHIFSKKHLQ